MKQGILPLHMKDLLEQATTVYNAHFDGTVRFERSIFTNWTCAIADCRYCYLSTKPKHRPGTETTALRTKESIWAEALLCKKMGWHVSYITGGLRVERIEQLIPILEGLEKVLGYKVMMNYGPFAKSEVQKLAPYVTGMGSAIESFDETLHNEICPSKPLHTLTRYLEVVHSEGLKTLITIILGLGETKDDLDMICENIEKYNIDIVQLCFLKPQEGTPYADVPSPDTEYMAWWAAQLRIKFPTLYIKVALVPECVDDFHLLLDAGVNAFSRFMIYKHFGTDLAQTLVSECSGRLQGEFLSVPQLTVEDLPFDKETNEKVEKKFWQYVKRLR